MTLTYLTTQPAQVATTCYQGEYRFKDANGQSVFSGALPACSTIAPMAPCVVSIESSGPQVTKKLLVPAGDSKVGTP